MYIHVIATRIQKFNNCGSDYHRYNALEEKTKCPAHGRTCCICNRTNHLHIVWKSRTKKKDNNEVENDMVTLLQFSTAPKICSNTTAAKLRRRYLGQMR